MAKLPYGEEGVSAADTIAKMEASGRAAGVAADRLSEKVGNLEKREASLAGTEEGLANVSEDLAAAQAKLAEAISHSGSILATETAEWEANNAALNENLRLRRALSRTVTTTGGAIAEPTAAPVRERATPTPVVREPRPTAAPEAVYGPQTRMQAAIIDAEAARQAVTEARRTGATRQELAPLIEQRQVANDALTAARAEARARMRAAEALTTETAAVEEDAAATRNLAGMRGEQMAQQSAAPVRYGGFYGEAGGRDLVAALEANAARIEEAGLAVSQRAPLMLPPGRRVFEAGPATPAVEFLPGGGSYQGPPPPRQPPVTVAPGGAGGEPGRGGALAGEGTALDELAAKQMAANRAVMASGVAYAESSNALSRHGALTTEFIQALARGDVTLREFSSQMVSTIGKFGGWAVAGAAVYGVVKVFEDMRKGAEDTQNAVANLGRWIPGLGGPAGGGAGQVPQAEMLLRQIATQFNEPIGQVSDSMQVVARVFHSLGDAGEATRAVLAVSKLDQVPVTQATQYLLGISQSMGWSSATPITGVVDTLNELQNRIGARVQQTLPAVARAAPAALAGGVDIQHVEALAGLGVAAGLQGGVVGTALARSLGGYIFRPSAQEAFARYGIRPSDTSAQGVLDAVFKRIDQGGLGQQDLRAIANAFTTNVSAVRVMLPILEQAAAHPGRYQEALGYGYRPPSYQHDLDAVLSSVSERFRAIGVSLQTFGSELASAGVLTPLTAGLTVIHTFIGGLQSAVSPITGVSRLLGDLAGPLRDFAILLAAAGLAALAYRRTFLGSTAEQFIGRLSTSEQFTESPRQVVRQRLAEIRNILLPDALREQEQARAQVMQRQISLASARETQRSVEEEARRRGLVGEEMGVAAPGTGKAGEAYEAESEAALNRVNRATRGVESARERELAASTRVVQLETDKQVLSGQIKDAEGKVLSWKQKQAYAEERGYIATEEINNLKAEVAAETRRIIASLAGQAGGGRAPIAGGAVGTMAGTTEAAAVGTVAMGVAGTEQINRVMDRLESTTSNFTEGMQQNFGLMGGMLPGAARTGRFGAPGTGAPPPIAGQPLTQAEQEADAQMREMSQRLTQESIARATTMMGMIAPALTRVGESAAIQGLINRIPSREQLTTWARGVAPFAPFAGLMATSYIGQQIGGGTGQAISNIGGAAFTGALIAQMFGAGARGMGVGVGLAQVAQGFGQGGAAGGAVSLAAGGVGAGVGALVGGPLGAAVGFGIGSTVGNIASTIFGIGQTAAASPQSIKDQASKIENAVNSVGAQYSDALTQMFASTGQAGQNAGAKVQQVLQDMSARMLLFGAQSQQGRQAVDDMRQILQAGIDRMDTDPTAAQSTIQGVMQATNQAVTRSTALLKYADPGQVDKIISEGMSALKFDPSKLTMQGASETDLVEQARRQAEEISKQEDRAQQARGQYHMVRQQRAYRLGMDPAYTMVRQYEGAGTDPEKVLDQLRQAKATTDKQLEDLRSMKELLNSLYKDAQQQLIAAGLQVKEAPIQTAAVLAETQTWTPRGMDVTAQARIQREADARTLAMTREQYQRTPSEPLREQMAQQAAKLQQDMQAYGQSRVADMQATAAAREAAIPSTDPLRRAKDALAQETAIYQYMTQHSEQFTTQQLQQQLQAKNAAQQAYNDTSVQVATDIAAAHEQLVESQAQGDPFKIADAQAALGRTNLHLARNQQQRDAANAQINNAGTARAEATRNAIQAQGQLTETLETGDSVAQAQTAIALGRAMLRTALNTTEQTAAEQMIAAGNVQLHQAYMSRIQVLGQIQETAATGDTVLQAQIAQQTAAKMQATAHGVDEMNAANQMMTAANVQLHQAYQNRTQAEGQLQQTLDTGDAAKQARDAQATAHKLLANAHGIDEQIAGQEAVAAANAQAHQVTLSRIQSAGQLQQTRDTGDTVRQAQDAQKTARDLMRNAHGQDEVRAAEQAMASANAQYRQALEQRDIALGELAASTTADPVQQLTDRLQAAIKALSKAKGKDERAALQTTVNNLRMQRDQTAASDAEDQIDYAFQMMQISAGDAISQLEGILAKYHDLPPQMVRQINEQIRRYQLGLEQPMGSTGFDLAPGDLKLPTFYDVGRGLATGQVQQTAPRVNAQYAATVNVYVTQAGDENAVAAVLDQALNTNVQQRMRAAGVI